LAELNIWIRTGNRVYLVLAEKKTRTFDEIFDMTTSIDWRKYIPKDAPIIVDAVSVKSDIDSIPAIQKTIKKSIVTKITGDRESILREDDKVKGIHIFALIRENTTLLLLDTSGEPLHKRGYRTEALEAPIKETLAAAMVMLSGWRYKEPFLDPFCGSGTIAIEAAMIAKNIAPGLERSFAAETFPWYPVEYFKNAKMEAKGKIIVDKKYTITASDTDKEAVKIAENNAKRAGVSDTMTILQKDFKSYVGEYISGSLVSNPPYGIRLQDYDLDLLYKDIAIVFNKNTSLFGGLITSYDFSKHTRPNTWKNRKLYNGNELCYFYTKKFEAKV
jgi:putative N6-adenine-specific DNA methylase